MLWLTLRRIESYSDATTKTMLWMRATSVNSDTQSPIGSVFCSLIPLAGGLLPLLRMRRVPWFDRTNFWAKIGSRKTARSTTVSCLSTHLYYHLTAFVVRQPLSFRGITNLRFSYGEDGPFKSKRASQGWPFRLGCRLVYPTPSISNGQFLPFFQRPLP